MVLNIVKNNQEVSDIAGCVKELESYFNDYDIRTW